METTSKEKEIPALNPCQDNAEDICSHCGGNGYMKTSPNCYHTCLVCLGKGRVEFDHRRI